MRSSSISSRRQCSSESDSGVRGGGDGGVDAAGEDGRQYSNDVSRQGGVVSPRVGWKEKVIYLNSHRKLQLGSRLWDVGLSDSWLSTRVTFVSHVRGHRRALCVLALKTKIPTLTFVPTFLTLYGKFFFSFSFFILFI